MIITGRGLPYVPLDHHRGIYNVVNSGAPLTLNVTYFLFSYIKHGREPSSGRQLKTLTHIYAHTSTSIIPLNTRSDK
jgi:hypothetical protein